MSKDRATTEPGGCECHDCGCIFIGGPGHDICGDCDAARKEAMRRTSKGPNGALRCDAMRLTPNTGIKPTPIGVRLE